eukprot:TRINITY_DN27592_c0_g1_i1.p2 TRINITY_DN27592_c0_g1~~TRINITY_DN27592_c0_g1_i1.p2  ORF type:complete len:185 (+),score=30.31 TRINITY_DN27592_c0_g1_i1:52-606(+)
MAAADDAPPPPPLPRSEGGPYYPAPHPLQGVDLPLWIPSDKSLRWVVAPLRMRLVVNYMAACGYVPREEEAALLAMHAAKTCVQMALDVAAPIGAWVATAPPNSGRLSTRRSLGWPLPRRVAAVLACVSLLKTASGAADARTFQQLAALPSPLGRYARYISVQGRDAAARGLRGVPHPHPACYG